MLREGWRPGRWGGRKQKVVMFTQKAWTLFVLETKESHGWVLKRGDTGCRVEIGGRETN